MECITIFLEQSFVKFLNACQMSNISETLAHAQWHFNAPHIHDIVMYIISNFSTFIETVLAILTSRCILCHRQSISIVWTGVVYGCIMLQLFCSLLHVWLAVWPMSSKTKRRSPNSKFSQKAWPYGQRLPKQNAVLQTVITPLSKINEVLQTSFWRMPLSKTLVSQERCFIWHPVWERRYKKFSFAERCYRFRNNILDISFLLLRSCLPRFTSKKSIYSYKTSPEITSSLICTVLE